ncbi:MAG: TIM barrel protein [Planctomycetaceae bacterium]
MIRLNRRQFLASSALAAGVAVSPRSLLAAGKPRRFELGLVTYNVVKDWDLPTILKVCRDVGIAAVECRTTHRHGVEPSLTAGERRDVKSRFADSGVRFWGCGSTCEFHAADRAVVQKNVEECKRFVDLVADLGGVGVKVRPNGLPKDVPVEKTLEQIGAALVECGKAAGDAGVDVCVEVHGAGTQEPAHMKTIMEHCGHKSVGVTWNSNPGEVKNGSVADSFATLRPWLRSCHINELGNDATGKYPYRELFSLLRDANYDGYTLIEIGQAYPDVAQGTAYLRDYRTLWEQLANG